MKARILPFIVCLIAVSSCSSMKGEKGQDLSALTPEEVVRRWEAASTPGKQHTLLNRLTGKWEVETRMWMDPQKSPEVTSGISDLNWVLVGRFVKEEYKGKLMG